MRRIVGRCASSSVGGRLSSRSDRRHVGHKLGQATRTLPRTGYGKRKPGRSGTPCLYGISQLTPLMRPPTLFLDQARGTQSHTETHARAQSVLARFQAMHPWAVGKLKQGGVFASVLSAPTNAAEYPSISVKTMQVKADSRVLSHMAEAVRSGRLSIPLGQRFALKDANKAHAAAEKGAAGKIHCRPRSLVGTQTCRSATSWLERGDRLSMTTEFS